jgi:hypothetical protein
MFAVLARILISNPYYLHSVGVDGQYRPLCLPCNQSHAAVLQDGLSQQTILYIPIAIFQHTTSTTSVFTSPDVQTDLLRSIISMGQQSIVMYLSLKGLNAIEIHNGLVATLKNEAKSYGTVTYYLGKPSFSSPRTTQLSESPAPILNELNEAILLALSEEPFASVRQLARRLTSIANVANERHRC